MWGKVFVRWWVTASEIPILDPARNCRTFYRSPSFSQNICDEVTSTPHEVTHPNNSLFILFAICQCSSDTCFKVSTRIGPIHQSRAFSPVWLAPLTDGRTGADCLNIETYPRWNNREKSCISSSGLKLHHSWRLILPATDPLLSVSQPWAAGGEVTCFFFTTVKSW